jgi:cell division protein FtsQ
MKEVDPSSMNIPSGKGEKLTLVKKIAKVLIWFFCIVGISILFMKTLYRHDKLTCSHIDLKLENSGGFIDSKGFVKNLESHFQILNRPCESIHLLQIEDFVKSNPFVRSSDIFFDLRGTLHISLWQKIPALKVLNIYGETFLIDDQGLKIPLLSNPFSSLIKIEGDIREKRMPLKSGSGNSISTKDSLYSPELKLAFELWKRISRESKVLGKIEAFQIQPGNSISIKLRNLDIPLVFGDTSLLSEKLEKMEIFTQTILPRTGPATYSKVDLRFSGEWVCEKRNNPLKDSLTINPKINKLL